MNPFGDNPFAMLTFIVAPAILTNASSVMTLGTSNRFARAVDRARALSAQLEETQDPADPSVKLRMEAMRSIEKRALLLVRALTSFYVSLGSFAAASLVSLLGAVFFVSHHDSLFRITQSVALLAGVVGVGGLVSGSALLVWETRLTLRILREETAYMLRQSQARFDRT